MAAVDFFGAFQYQWGQAATSYAWDDAQWKNGWASIGSTPPSVAQFDAVQKLTDFKTKYLFDALNAIMTTGGGTFTSGNPATISTFLYRNPTTTLRGMPTLASAAEVQAGTDAAKAVTASTLSARTALETRTGIAAIANNAEAIAGAEDTKFMTAKKVLALIRAAAAQAGETFIGTLRIGTAVEVDAGTVDNVAVSPKNLRRGLVINIATNGYVVFPTWLGGLTIQWMRQTLTAADNDGGHYKSPVLSWPMTFPNTVFQAFVCHIGATAGLTAIIDQDGFGSSSLRFKTSFIGGASVWMFLGIGR